MQLGENIYILRSERGLSQGALADALEVSRQSVSKWENNTSVPELDKLIRMSKLFNVTLDELVFGRKSEDAKIAEQEKSNQVYGFPRISPRVLVGGLMLVFGMIFFLLSIFWGDKLYFGEEFGELTSIVIVLISIALLATYSFPILGFCALIYLLYSIVCLGIMSLYSIPNYLFLAVTGFVILIWFFVLGEKKSSEYKEKNESVSNLINNDK